MVHKDLVLQWRRSWAGPSLLCVLVPSWCSFKTISTQSRRLLLVERGGPLRLGEKPGLTQASDVRSETGLSRGFSLTIENWRKWLAEEGDIEAEDRIRRQTHTGRPCRATAFLDQVESVLHRTVRPKKRGPKPKPKENRKKRPTKHA
ncbi:MAG: hypothetical protein U9Q79_00565 [Candidatus Hydrogenedentes bacterium]|nr:hypothetical protein [Candidatus Hydrogenedentota bacterium]